MSKVTKDKISINGTDLSALIYCFKGIVESNPVLKREPAEGFSKTAKSIQDNYTEHYAAKLEEIQKEYNEFGTKFYEALPKDEDGKAIRTEESDKRFMEELAALKTIERSKEILDKEIEIDVWKVAFSIVKDMNYALAVKDASGNVQMPDYSVIEKFNLIYK